MKSGIKNLREKIGVEVKSKVILIHRVRGVGQEEISTKVSILSWAKWIVWDGFLRVARKAFFLVFRLGAGMAGLKAPAPSGAVR
jgi:hypothetical protein